MLAKERHRARLVAYLGDWTNKFPRRFEMPKILGIHRNTLYKHFSPEDLQEIENEGLELRKKNSGCQRAEIYQKMCDTARDGDLGSQKEFLDRTEGKVTDRHELTGRGGKDLFDKIQIEVVQASAEKS